VVLLTWNEERNIPGCLRSLASQTLRDFEVIIVDAASTDQTLTLIEGERHSFPMPLRVEASPTKLPIGEARNLGVKLAQAPVVVFLSADAEMDPPWLEHAVAALQNADMVFGRQLHAPHRWTLGAAVRGMRYHFPETPTDDPLRYASNVAAAYRKEILEAFPFDPWANAAEDLLLAKRAAAAGWRPAYDPRMIVSHHDVATGRAEMKKSVREGQGWGLYRAELGLFVPVLAWGATILAALVVLLLRLSVVPLLVFLVVLWLPAVRRALFGRHRMPLPQLLKAVFVSPLFDLVFLANYVRGLFGHAPQPPKPTNNNPQEIQP
jgi:glycosyltransferase involved in cell wall biosynthesis